MSNKSIFLAVLFAAGLIQSAQAGNKPALSPRSAALQCVDRKIELKATCYKETGYPGLSCTSQRLTIRDAASGRELGGQTYKPAPLETGDAYPLVDEKISDVACAETPAGQNVIVVKASNGGNCAQCEWTDVYAWDGALLGSSRDKSRSAEVDDAVKAAFGKKAKKIGQADFYSVYLENAPSVR